VTPASGSREMGKTAVVLLTHFIDPHILATFNRLKHETSGDYDVFLALNLCNKPLAAPVEAEALGHALFLCNDPSLVRLGYPEKCRPEGWDGKGWRSIDNVDTILLSFHREHPEYMFYWGVEYDVHYEGRWGFLFERFETSTADLIGTMIDTAAKTPFKLEILMPPFRRPDGGTPVCEELLVGFYPIHRLSQKMLHALDASYSRGWSGHYEFTWATLAREHRLEIEDIGGKGPYVRPQNRDVFYFNTISRWDMSPGTFVFRPSFTKVKKRANTLWHPVKAKGDYYNHCPAGPGKNAILRLRHLTKTIWYAVGIWAWFAFRWRPATSSPVNVPESGANKACDHLPA
jgi:hypothetical protein